MGFSTLSYCFQLAWYFLAKFAIIVSGPVVAIVVDALAELAAFPALTTLPAR